MPDSVEGVFNIRRKADQRVEQQQDANANENASSSAFEIGIDEPHYCLGHLRRETHILCQLLLDELVEAEATGYGEDDGQNRHGTEDAGVGKSRSVGR